MNEYVCYKMDTYKGRKSYNTKKKLKCHRRLSHYEDCRCDVCKKIEAKLLQVYPRKKVKVFVPEVNPKQESWKILEELNEKMKTPRSISDRWRIENKKFYNNNFIFQMFFHKHDKCLDDILAFEDLCDKIDNLPEEIQNVIFKKL